MKPGQRVIVRDTAADDFGTASKHVNPRAVTETYNYQHRNPLWWLAASLLYYVLVPPVALVLRVMYGIRIRNRRAVASAGGCYLYGNHTHWVDVFMPFLLGFPRRAWVVAGPTAVSLPLVRHIVPMVGGVPLNTTVAGKIKFRAALADAVAHGQVVGIFPEAHDWPYYNGIRDFPDRSFSYPVRTGAPVVPYVVTYRRRRWRTNRPPHITITVGQPIRPADWAGAADPKRFVRDRVYDFMVATVAEQDSYGFVEYRQADAAPDHVSPGDTVVPPA